ncbi:hypothetical protein HG536_0E02850 [Torulaspora globosa]|uniref:PH domain-containing protein n=1 Tax=Torulaspora globosa TaxID=48254 RepID=A0A7G3ZIN8_9SACH|nr:uncharacterized protein HG536_0E02850 [Torulaspora globosa]QLL33374.1 hypothetical protein HG536_0E02850 [Torulaspora globosa]
METIDIQSRSFVVRWVECSKGDVISYQVRPLKKSIELGIYKKPKGGVDRNCESAVHIAPDTRALLSYTTKSFLHRNSATSVDESANSSSTSVNSVPGSYDSRKLHGSLSLSNIQQQSQEIPLREKLTASGFTMVQWIGHVAGSEMQQGLLEVRDDDYYYAFILDNTSAKNAKKKILFNAKTVRDNELQSLNKNQYPLSPATTPKARSLKSQPNDDLLSVDRGRYLQGYLLKKRRKKLQGFTKRFFSLDFKYSTLSYYLNEHNQTCRGEIVINLATVSANKKDRLIIIDSGMELWVLKAKDTGAWSHWVDALQSCFDRLKMNKATANQNRKKEDGVDELNEALESVKTGKQNPTMANMPFVAITPNEFTASLPRFTCNELITNLKLIQQRVEYCKKESLNYVPTEGYDNQRRYRNASSSSADLKVAHGDSCESAQSLTISPDNEATEHPLHSRLSELETFLAQFIHQSRTLLNDALDQSLEKRISSISAFSDEEFFDAEDGISHGVILLDNDERLEEPTLNKTVEYESVSEEMTCDSSTNDIYPLPWGKSVKRRNDVRAAVASPPSLLSFLRKNVGKDLSSVAMPVTSNEPISILQLISETFEYSDLLNKAIESTSKAQVLTYVSAFAISCLSIHRDKTRALRKPFNPLLGETYELVREDMGFRLIAEKVSHRPPVFAFHADHPQWECSYTVSPLQRFWGKSVELNNDGTVRLKFKNQKDSFEWVQPTTMLKNLIAGERYVEPINEFEVNSSSCGSSTIAFQSAGIFGGRSENLTLTIDPVDGAKKTLHGKWTESIIDDSTSAVIWQAGKLVPDSRKKYGFTVFTANLNEITEIERDNLPPTDSRLRPDIKAYEEGNVQKAETLKLKLEQAQRDRRSKGSDVKPKFFEKSKNDTWKLIQGPNSYWERRKRRDWSGITALW